MDILKRLLILAFALLSTFSFCVFSQAQPLNIKIVTEDLRPYNYLEHGTLKGVGTEVVLAVQRHLGMQTDIEVYPWARAFAIATSEPNTMIYTIGRSEKREKLFQWVGVIAPVKYSLFSLGTRKDIEIYSLDDARQFTIGTVNDDVREQYLLAQGFVKNRNLLSTADYKNNFQMLLRNRIDLWAISELVAYDYVRSLGYPKDVIKKVYFFDELSTEGGYMAFSLDTPGAVVAQFKDGLTAIKQDGTYQKILDKHYLH